MSRVKCGVTTNKRHKKVIHMAKGYTGRNKNCFRIALQRVERGLLYAYRDRKNKKRDFRKLWVQRINAAVRQFGLTYSVFMHAIKEAGIELDRKMLSDIAINNPAQFKMIITSAKAAISKAAAEIAVVAKSEAEAVTVSI